MNTMNDAILFWNEVASDATKMDFSVSMDPEQGGPTKTSRALAIVHIAMYDAYVGIFGGAGTYLSYAPATPGTNNLLAARAAVASAATLTLISLYSRQKDALLKKQQEFLMKLKGNNPEIDLGIAWGTLVASRILAERKNDGSDTLNTFYTPNTEPGRHRPDPVNPTQGFLGPLWGKVTPFGINNLTNVVPGIAPPRWVLQNMPRTTIRF
jgi:Vanadium chloroperoxidase N-terminal domain